MKLKHKRLCFLVFLLCLLVGVVTIEASAASTSGKLKTPVVTLSNVASTGKIKISWQAISGAKSYKVYRSTDNKNWTRLITTTKTSTTNTSAVAGKKYYYKVMAVASKTANNSSYSTVKNRTCDLPRPDITLENVASSGKIKISWDAISGAKSYKVYRSTDNKNWTRLITTTKTSTTNTSTVAGKKYYYKVMAVASNSAADSAYSTVKYRTCDLARPTITLSNVESTGKIKISWGKIDGAKSYSVYRSTDNKNWSRLITTTKTSTTNTSAVAGTKYYYKVIANASSSAANSAYSTVKYRTCNHPAGVLSLSGSITAEGKPRLTWNKVANAEKYKVYRAFDEDGPFKLLSTTTSSSMTNSTVGVGVTYYYRIEAINSKGSKVCDGDKMVCLTTPATGEVKKTQYVSDSEVKLYPYPDSSSSYITIPYKTQVQVGCNATSSDSGNWIRVFYNSQLHYVWLSKGDEKFVAEIPDPVLTVTTALNDAGKPRVLWNKLLDAASYKVYRSLSRDGEYNLISTTSYTSMTNSSALAGVEYFYRVEALDVRGNVICEGDIVSATAKVTGEVLQDQYVSIQEVSLFQYPNSESAVTTIGYREPVKLGMAITSGEDGVWTRVFYQDKLYYVWMMPGVEKFTSEYPNPQLNPTVTLNENGKPKVSWNKLPDAVSYNIYRSFNESDGFTLLSNVTFSSWNNNGALAGVQYFYKVEALDAGGNVIPQNAEIVVSGTAAVEGENLEDKYVSMTEVSLYQHPDSESAVTPIGYREQVKLGMAITSGEDGVWTRVFYNEQLYYVWMMPGVEKFTSEYPNPQLNPTVTLNENGKPKVSWNKLPNAVSYNIYRSFNESDGFTLLSNVTYSSLNNNGALEGVQYFYKVEALDAGGNVIPQNAEIVVSGTAVVEGENLEDKYVSMTEVSLYQHPDSESAVTPIGYREQVKLGKAITSGEDGVWTRVFYNEQLYYVWMMPDVVKFTSEYPNPQLNPTVTLNENGKPKVSWNKLPNAVSYNIYRSFNESDGFTCLSNVPYSSWNNDGALAGVQYFYKVEALDAGGNVIPQNADIVVSGTAVVEGENLQDMYIAVKEVNLYQHPDSESAVTLASYRDTVKLGMAITSGVDGVWTRVFYNEQLYYVWMMPDVVKFTAEYPNPQLNPTITLNEGGKPKLAWTTIPDAAKYNVYRSYWPDQNFTLLSTTEYTSMNNDAAGVGLTYYYRVEAVNEHEEVIREQTPAITITTPLPEGEVRTVNYLAQEWTGLFRLPHSSSESVTIPYMTEVELGMIAMPADTGNWYRVFYKGELYYTWIALEETMFTPTKSTFTYTGSTPHHQEALDLALDIVQNWRTVYEHEQSNGIPHPNGTYGFDCSGFVKYVFNTVMQKYVPTFRLSSAIEVLLNTTNIYNAGYPGEMVAYEVALEDIQPGDVVFFTQKSENDHCGIYLGNGEFAHSSVMDWENSVCIMPLAGQYLEQLSVIRRYLPAEITPANTTEYINTGLCKIYVERSSSSEILYTFAKFEEVTVLYTNDSDQAYWADWVYVRAQDGTEGYMLKKNLDKSL